MKVRTKIKAGNNPLYVPTGNAGTNPLNKG
jgi:hypothetical protein